MASLADLIEPWGTFLPKGWRKLWIQMGQNSPLGRGSLRRFWVKHLRKSGDIIDQNVSGARLRLILGDNRSEIKAIVQSGRFMAYEQDTISRLAASRDDLKIIDIGANAGLFSAIALAKSGRRAELISIEPNPLLAQRLSQNIAFNRADRAVHIVEAAIGAEDATLHLQFDENDLGRASLAEIEASEKVDVPVRPLLSIIEEAGFDRVDLLKIDIEGFEDEALVPFFETAPEAIWPKIILIEVAHAHRWNSDLRSVWTEIGYTITEERGPDLTLTRQ